MEQINYIAKATEELTNMFNFCHLYGSVENEDDKVVRVTICGDRATKRMVARWMKRYSDYPGLKVCANFSKTSVGTISLTENK